MKKILLTTLLLATVAIAQTDGARVLTGSAVPPLPFNILTNATFEDRTTGWGVTGGVFTATSNSADVARGRFSVSWTIPSALAVGAVFQSNEVAIPPGLYGRSCIAALLMRGVTDFDNDTNVDDLEILAFDGTNELGNKLVAGSSTYARVQTNSFICPSSGNLRLRIKVLTNPGGSYVLAPLFIDEAYLGDLESFGGSGGGQLAVSEGNSISAAGVIPVGVEVRALITVQGDAAPVTANATTQLSAGTLTGQERTIIGLSDTDTVTIPAGGNCQMNGPIVLGKDDAITYVWNNDPAILKWIEISRKGGLR